MRFHFSRAVHVWTVQVEEGEAGGEGFAEGDAPPSPRTARLVSPAPPTALAALPGCNLSPSAADGTTPLLVVGDKAGHLQFWRLRSAPAAEASATGAASALWEEAGRMVRLKHGLLRGGADYSQYLRGTEASTAPSGAAAVVCIAGLARPAGDSRQLLAASTAVVTEKQATEAAAEAEEKAEALPSPLAPPCSSCSSFVWSSSAVFLVDADAHSVLAVLSAHSDVVRCMCALPDGGK